MPDVEPNAAAEASLYDTVAAAYESSEAVTEPVAQETEDQGRARDEQGRFSAPVPEVVDPAPAAETVPEPRKAPQSWKEEYKAQFNALPDAIQEEILRRETDYSKGIQRYAETAKYGETLKPVVDNWQPYLNELGVRPEQAFDAMLHAEKRLRTGSPAEKLQTLHKLAQDYGINLGQAPEQQQLDPNVQHALSRVQHLEEHIRQQQYAQQQSQQSEIQKAIDGFAKNPKHPHFESVRDDMSKLLQAGYAESMDEAYEKAVWARPDIRSTLLADEAAKRIKDEAEKAKQAKQRASSIKGSPSGVEVRAAGASIRSDVEDAWSKHS